MSLCGTAAVLAVKVADPSGRPVPGYRVWVVPAEHAGERAVPRGVGGEGIAQTSDQRSTSDHADGLVFRAPMSGRFYSRPAPDKPAFVKPGDRVRVGTTVCLLEVMKTFNRVKYAGEPAKVARVVPADGDDVEAGDPLLELER